MGRGQLPGGGEGPFLEMGGGLGHQNDRAPGQGPLPVSEGTALREGVKEMGQESKILIRSENLWSFLTPLPPPTHFPHV